MPKDFPKPELAEQFVRPFGIEDTTAVYGVPIIAVSSLRDEPRYQLQKDMQSVGYWVVTNRSENLQSLINKIEEQRAKGTPTAGLRIVDLHK